MRKTKLHRLAERLGSELSLGPLEHLPRCTDFLRPVTMREALRKFKGTVFLFEKDKFRFVDRENNLAVNLNGKDLNPSSGKYTTFTLELSQLS